MAVPWKEDRHLYSNFHFPVRFASPEQLIFVHGTTPTVLAKFSGTLSSASVIAAKCSTRRAADERTRFALGTKAFAVDAKSVARAILSGRIRKSHEASHLVVSISQPTKYTILTS